MRASLLTTVLCLVSATVNHSFSDAQDRSAISGTVFFTGQTAQDEREGVRVSLVGYRQQTTDGSGHFVFVDVAPGRYRLAVTDPRFLSSDFGAVGPNVPGAIVDLGPGQSLSNANVRLYRGAVVAGIIRDDLGLPTANSMVSLNPLDEGRPSRTITTDASGAYRFSQVVPGAYLLSVGSSGKVNISSADVELQDLPFYSGQTYDPDQAQVLILGPDEVFEGVDLVRPPRRRGEAHGRVSWEGVPTPDAAVWLRIGRGDRARYQRVATTNERGEFSLRGIPPGQYSIIADLQLRRAGSGRDNTQKRFSAQDVQILEDTRSTVDLRLEQSRSMSGIVTVDESVPPVGVGVTVSLAGFGPLGLLSAQAGEGGGFVVQGVQAGRYLLKVDVNTNGAENYWLYSVAIDGHLQFGPAVVVPPQGAAIEATLGVTSRQAGLNGTVRDRTGLPVFDVDVIAFRENELVPGSCVVSHPDTKGRFQFRNLPPGRYVIATSEIYRLNGACSGTEVLDRVRRDGAPVAVTLGGQASLDLQVARSLAQFDRSQK